MFELRSSGYCNTITLKIGCWLPDCQHIAMGSEDAKVHIWRLPARASALAPAGRRLSRTTFILTPVAKLTGHLSVVNCCSAVPVASAFRGAPLLATCGVEKMIRVWGTEEAFDDVADALKPDGSGVCPATEEELEVTQAFSLRAEISRMEVV
eukprot:Polyplicarium_translucidae@DN3229_c0_g1_i1.p5